MSFCMEDRHHFPSAPLRKVHSTITAHVMTSKFLSFISSLSVANISNGSLFMLLEILIYKSAFMALLG